MIWRPHEILSIKLLALIVLIPSQPTWKKIHEQFGCATHYDYALTKNLSYTYHGIPRIYTGGLSCESRSLLKSLRVNRIVASALNSSKNIVDNKNSKTGIKFHWNLFNNRAIWDHRRKQTWINTVRRCARCLKGWY